MIYLASPYSSPHEEVREARYKEALSFVASHLENSFVYSPIVYYHQVAKYNKSATDAETWRRQNHDALALAEKVYVLVIDGTEHSEGVIAEVHLACVLFKQVTYWLTTTLNPQEAHERVDAVRKIVEGEFYDRNS